jgi:hypothetical protein
MPYSDYCREGNSMISSGFCTQAFPRQSCRELVPLEGSWAGPRGSCLRHIFWVCVWVRVWVWYGFGEWLVQRLAAQEAGARAGVGVLTVLAE